MTIMVRYLSFFIEQVQKELQVIYLRVNRLCPSGNGVAQEESKVTYRFGYDFTKRSHGNLLLEGRKSVTIGGDLNGSRNIIDVTRYRFDASTSYKITRNWSVIFVFRYLEHEYSYSEENSHLNAVFVNLYLNMAKVGFNLLIKY